MPAASARDLVAGSGTVSMTSGSKVLTFSAAQSFKEGATVSCANGQVFTIDVGSGTTWTTIRDATATGSGQAFNTSDPGTGRSRGTSGIIVPGSRHFMYRSPLDGSGNPDWYFYFDTLFPENGLHPYTLDQFTGNAWVAALSTAMVPDLATRIRRLEGCVRGSTADATDPDSRLDSLTARIYALEQWANQAGHFGTPPSVGSNTTYTMEQLTSYGDVTAA